MQADELRKHLKRWKSAATFEELSLFALSEKTAANLALQPLGGPEAAVSLFRQSVTLIQDRAQNRLPLDSFAIIHEHAESVIREQFERAA